MDPNLTKILILFSVYAIVGLIPLWWAWISESRWESVLAGFMLIFYASFLLSGIALLTESSHSLLSGEDANEYVKSQLKVFSPYVVFFGSVFTFLFGGVGVNVLSSAFATGSQVDINHTLRRIELRLDSVSEKVEYAVRIHWLAVFLNALVFVVAVVLLVWKV